MVAKNEVSKQSFKDFVLIFFSGKSYLKYLIILSISIVAGAVLIWKINPSADSQAVEVDWRLLGELDYITGKGTSELDALDGKAVKIPGFMVPLEDNTRNVTDFLLVPSPQACIHVPPPPPNQMVFVKMEDKGAEAAFGPIWVYGTLHLKSKKHMYGESSFSLSGLRTEPYR
jgi:uncharacterized protein